MSNGQGACAQPAATGRDTVPDEPSVDVYKWVIAHLIVFAVLFFLLVYVVPEFVEIYEDFSAALPQLTRLISRLSNAMTGPAVSPMACLGLLLGLDTLVMVTLYRRNPRLVKPWATGVVILVGLLGDSSALPSICRSSRWRMSSAAEADPLW